jgi:hypothetical protein
MAGDWIKMRTNLDTDPRVIEIATRLRIGELQVVGMLWKVWSWADAHTLDGNAIRVTDVTLDRFTLVTGFADALRKVGWLEGRDGLLTFPRFAEHNGQTAKNRAETKERVAKHRNAKPVTDVTPKPLPEKRREEKSLKKENTRGEEFGNCWSKWKRHLGQIQKPLSQITEETQLMQLSRIYPNDEDAIQAIEYSISVQAKNLILNGDHRPKPQSFSSSSSTKQAKSNDDLLRNLR